MRRNRAADNAASSTPTPAGRAPMAPARPSRLKQSVAAEVAESSSSSSGARSRQTFSEDDLVKRMAATKLAARSTKEAAVGPPRAPRKVAATTKAMAGSADTAGSEEGSMLTASAKVPKVAPRALIRKGTTAIPARASDGSTKTPISPAQQTLSIKTNINLVFRKLTSAIASGYRREGQVNITPARVRGGLATPAGNGLAAAATKTPQSEDKENVVWTEETVVKVIKEGAEGFRELAKQTESKERIKIREMENLRAGFAGKCIALGFPEHGLDSLVEGRTIILTLYPSAALPSRSAKSEPANKAPARKTPVRTSRTPKSATPLAPVVPETKPDWVALSMLPEVEIKTMEQIEERSRAALCNHALTSWVGLCAVLESEPDVKKLISILRSPNIDDVHDMHPLSLARHSPSDSNLASMLNHAIQAIARLERKVPMISCERTFQLVKLQLWITSASMSAKITSGQVWATCERSASRFFNIKDRTEEAEMAGMRGAAALLEEAFDYGDRATSGLPVKLEQKGEEWFSLTTMWMALGKHLEEEAIVNRAAMLQEQSTREETTDLAHGLQGLSIRPEDPAALLAKAHGTLVKLILAIDKARASPELQDSSLLSGLKDLRTLRTFFTALGELQHQGLAGLRPALNALDRAQRRVITLCSGRKPSQSHSAAARAWLTIFSEEAMGYMDKPSADKAIQASLREMAIDVLCERAKEELDVGSTPSIQNASAWLQAALSIRDQSSSNGEAPSVAEWTRYIGMSYYIVGGKLWKASMKAPALEFLQPAAELGSTLLQQITRDDQSPLLADQLSRRWEIVATCCAALSDKSKAATAYLRSILVRGFAVGVDKLREARLLSRGLASIGDKDLDTCIARLSSCCLQDAFAFGRDWTQHWRMAEAEAHSTDFSLLVFEEVARNLEKHTHREGVALIVETICSTLLERYLGEGDAARRLSLTLILARLGAGVDLASHNLSEVLGESLNLMQRLKPQIPEGHPNLSLAISESQSLICKATAQYNHQSSQSSQLYMPGLLQIRDILRQVFQSDATHISEPLDMSEISLAGDYLDIAHVLGEFLPIVRIVGTSMIVLDFLRLLRQAQSHVVPFQSNYVHTSCQLAFEYAALGKIARARKVFAQTEHAISRMEPLESQSTLLYLNKALFFATIGETEDCNTAYAMARTSAEDAGDASHVSANAKIRQRVEFLDKAASAHVTAAEVALGKDNATDAILHRGSAYKLLNRALESLSRLTPAAHRSCAAPTSGHPFTGPPIVRLGPGALSADESARSRPTAWQDVRVSKVPGEHLRISAALISTMCLLGRDYSNRGSAKDAEALLSQASDLAESIQSKIWIARTACLLGEVYSAQYKFDAASCQIERAISAFGAIATADSVELARVKGMLKLRQELPEEALKAFAAILQLLSDCESNLTISDSPARGRTSLVQRSPDKSAVVMDGLPWGSGTSLARHARLLQAAGEEEASLEVIARLASTAISGADKALLQQTTGTVAVTEAFSMFRNDLFMNSLTESALSIPSGSANNTMGHDASRQGTIELLCKASSAFEEYLAISGGQGEVQDVREAAVTSALLMCYQTSLGRMTGRFSTAAAGLLDLASSLTLSRELSENALTKSRSQRLDDCVWPDLATERLPSLQSCTSLSTSESMGTSGRFHNYWLEVANRHRQSFSLDVYQNGDIDRLPRSWAIVYINLTEDHKSLIVTKHKAGQKPVMFCLPVDRQGKREEEEEESFTYDVAVGELGDIIDASDSSAKAAKDTTTKEGKAAWWAMRMALDTRLEELLRSIEFCWLGAFKTIFQSTASLAEHDLETFRQCLQRCFSRALANGSGVSSVKLELDVDIVRCFAALSPDAKPEEVEDLVYYLLDLYQFHGVPVAQSEVDIDQLGIEVQAALQALHSKGQDCEPDSRQEDEHLFLVLDRKVQRLPWESIPVLRGRSISRIPSMAFLFDRLPLDRSLIGWRKEVPINKTQFVVNPSEDLKNTQTFFEPWLKDMKEKYAWRGVVGEPPSELQLKGMLKDSDLVLYMGHGGAEAYIRSQQIRSLRTCATTMLWGCSSGKLVSGGDLDPTGTPYNYMIAGCPSLVANLWDITDRDIDRMTMTVYQRTGLMADHTKYPLGKVSNAAAVNGARDGCKLKYLTGAAPVVYGLPVYLVEA